MWFITARQLMNITLGDKKIPRYQVKPPRCGAHSGDGISSYSQQHWLKAFRDNKQGLKHTFPFQVHSLTYKKRGLTSLNMINCETVDYRSILVYIFSDISQLQFAPQTNTGWYYYFFSKKRPTVSDLELYSQNIAETQYSIQKYGLYNRNLCVFITLEWVGKTNQTLARNRTFRFWVRRAVFNWLRLVCFESENTSYLQVIIKHIVFNQLCNPLCARNIISLGVTHWETCWLK